MRCNSNLNLSFSRDNIVIKRLPAILDFDLDIGEARLHPLCQRFCLERVTAWP